MARCAQQHDLKVHRKACDGGKDLGNAKVLCNPCHEATSTYGIPGSTPSPFSDYTKVKALLRAGHQCECTRVSGCH